MILFPIQNVSIQGLIGLYRHCEMMGHEVGKSFNLSFTESSNRVQMYVCIIALHIICATLLFLTLDMTYHKNNCQEMKMAGNETALQQKLFSDYNKFRKPVRLFSDRVPVLIQLYPLSIQKLDMKSQTLHSAIWLEIQWTDEYLTRNSSDFDNIQCLRIPATQVWVPSICNVKKMH